jgi:hypothetical protein
MLSNRKTPDYAPIQQFAMDSLEANHSPVRKSLEIPAELKRGKQQR